MTIRLRPNPAKAPAVDPRPDVQAARERARAVLDKQAEQLPFGFTDVDEWRNCCRAMAMQAAYFCDKTLERMWRAGDWQAALARLEQYNAKPYQGTPESERAAKHAGHVVNAMNKGDRIERLPSGFDRKVRA